MCITDCMGSMDSMDNHAPVPSRRAPPAALQFYSSATAMAAVKGMVARINNKQR